MQRAGHDVEARACVIELEPVLDLVQATAGIVRIIRLHDVLVRLLVIEVNHRARLAVQRHMHIPLIVHAEPDLASDPIRRALRLRARVVVEERRHPGLRVQHEILLAEQTVIGRKLHFVVAGRRAERPGVGLVQRVEWTAAVERLRVVHRAPVPIHERAIHAIVRVALALRPEGQVRARHPQAIARDAARAHGFTHAHQTFAERRVTGEQGRRGRSVRIRRAQMEGDQGTRRLAGNRACEQTVAGLNVATCAIITHRHARQRRRRIKAVTNRETRDAIGIIHVGRHHDGFVRLRQHRCMRHVSDRRSRVDHRARIRRAGRTEISRDVQFARAFHPLPAQAQENVRIALEPATVGADHAAIRAARRHHRDCRANPVRARVTTFRGEHMQRVARAADTVLHKRTAMRSLEEPTRISRLETGIRHAIRLSIRTRLNVVEQTLARTFEEQLQPIRIARRTAHAELHQRIALNQRPRRLLRFIAVRPVRGEAVVRVHIDQFKRAAAAVAPFTPTPAVAVGHFVDVDMEEVRRDDRAVRAQVDVRHAERDAFAAVRQLTVVVAHDLRRRQPRMPRE